VDPASATGRVMARMHQAALHHLQCPMPASGLAIQGWPRQCHCPPVVVLPDGWHPRHKQDQTSRCAHRWLTCRTVQKQCDSPYKPVAAHEWSQVGGLTLLTSQGATATQHQHQLLVRTARAAAGTLLDVHSQQHHHLVCPGTAWELPLTMQGTWHYMISNTMQAIQWRDRAQHNLCCTSNSCPPDGCWDCYASLANRRMGKQHGADRRDRAAVVTGICADMVPNGSQPSMTVSVKM
jgi:hypothetical protein